MEIQKEMSSKKRTLASSGQRVVVTGYGCLSPLGLNVEDTWNGAVEGRSGAAAITQFDPAGLETTFACEVKGFDPEKFIPKKEIRRMDRFIQLGLAASHEAVGMSGFLGKVPGERVGVLLGSGMGGLIMVQSQMDTILNRSDRLSPFFIPAVISNLLAGHVSMTYGLKGPNHCIVSACASSAHAVGEAARLIERGDCDIVVAGGAEATICKTGIVGFNALKALSTRNDEPQRASRPFDMDRDGFVMGEGSGILILESLESAQKRGAKILGEIVGYGMSADAHHITQPAPGGEGAARCMRVALEDAGLNPFQIEHINMHGTSTPVGDQLESMAVETVFGEHAKNILCTSTKSMTGHLLGAAGALEAILSLKALEMGVSPPTINLDNQDPECRLNYTPMKAQKKSMTYAMSNSFGFGGTNVTLILKKAI